MPSTVNRTAVHRETIAFPSGQDASVGKGLAVLHRVGVRVEEVVRGGNHFVTDDGVEVTNLEGQVVVGEFAVELRQGQAVLLTRAAISVGGAKGSPLASASTLNWN